METFFRHGSRWIRADFHLHTVADKEFSFQNPQNRSFKTEYIDQLVKAGVNLGVITNHNKFDLGEFKSLLKEARKKNIFLLPGVELSVNDGANGIHCLIAFDYDSWIKNNEDFINQFLTAAFEGIANRENENTRCKYNLDETIKRLDTHRKQGRDSFVVMAHVHQNSGFLTELDGGRIAQFGKDKLFKEMVLGFQKFRNREDEEKLKSWLDGHLISHLEGSDCKKIEDVGKPHTQNGSPRTCYLKLGAFTFEAVKFALLHHEERVSQTLPATQDLYLHEMEITRKHGSTNIPLNSDMNALIGVRGSGKSSLLETLRYGLGIEIPKNGAYKNEIVHRFLGEGNQLKLHLADSTGALKYIVQREWGKAPKVLDANGIPLKDLLPQTLIPTVYYGQKDIEEMGKDFSAQLIEDKFLKAKLRPFHDREANLIGQIGKVFEEIKKIPVYKSKLDETNQKIAELRHRIEEFERSGLQELVARELNFSEDESRLERIGGELAEMANRLLEVVDSYGWATYLGYQSKVPENQPFFEETVFPVIREILQAIEVIRQGFTEQTEEDTPQPSLLKKWSAVLSQFDQLRESFQEEFRQAKQQIENPNISVEAHKENRRQFEAAKRERGALEQKIVEAEGLERQLYTLLQQLEEVRDQMFSVIKAEMQQLNNLGLSFQINVTHQGDKEAFKDWLFNGFKGLHRENHALRIADAYTSPVAIYRDLYNDSAQLATILRGGSLLPKFREDFIKNAGMLTHKVPDKYQFIYNGRPLEQYSMGQKSTALIAFVLAHQDKKLFLIDQPEDDLDNYTVAKEIISRIRQLKPSTQFVFATHNPNLLVLGDSEQVVVCEHDDSHHQIAFPLMGSIDDPGIQERTMNIMEGGKEAFDRRKNIYQTWKHSN